VAVDDVRARLADQPSELEEGNDVVEVRRIAAHVYDMHLGAGEAQPLDSGGVGPAAETLARYHYDVVDVPDDGDNVGQMQDRATEDRFKNM
jgi:hypothetical protein